MSNDNVLLFITPEGNSITATGCRLVADGESAYGRNYIVLDRAGSSRKYVLYLEGGGVGSGTAVSEYIQNLHRAILDKIKDAWTGTRIVDLQELSVEGEKAYGRKQHTEFEVDKSWH